MQRPFRFKSIAAFCALATVAFGQTALRRATIVSAGMAEQGQCVIEVTIDEAAEVEIKGTQGLLRTISGLPAQWTALQCSGVMPPAPVEFRLKPADSARDAKLIQKPAEGSAAIIGLRRKAGTPQSIRFTVSWSGANNISRLKEFNEAIGPRSRVTGNEGAPAPNAMARKCEEAVIDLALQRLKSDAVAIRRSAMDNRLGRADYIIGEFEAREGRLWNRYNFECAMNFSNGRVRSADFQPIGSR